jgi:hypothetical protein
MVKLDSALPSTGKKLLRLAARGEGDAGARNLLEDADAGGGAFVVGELSSSFTGGDSATIGVEFGIGPRNPLVDSRTSIWGKVLVGSRGGLDAVAAMVSGRGTRP